MLSIKKLLKELKALSKKDKPLKADINCLPEYEYKINPMRDSVKIATIYGIIGTLWILASDKAAAFFFKSYELYKMIQIYKGWLYIAVTTLVIYVLIYRRLNLLKIAFKKICDNYEELNAAHEELIAMEEELLEQLEEIESNRNSLIESEQRYELAVEGSNDGIWDYDVENDIYFVSSKWKQFLGYDDYSIGSNLNSWLNIIHLDYKEIISQKLWMYINSESSIYKTTYKVICGDGSHKWILSRGKAIRDSKGKAIRIAGSHTDITEQILLQENLIHEKNLSQSIINNATLIIIVINKNEAIIDFNPYAEKLLGYSKSEVMNKNIIDLIIPDEQRYKYRGFFNLQNEDILNSEILKSHESSIVCRDGIHLDVLWNNNLIFDSSGDVIGIVAIGADISERKLLEKKLHSLAYYDPLTKLSNRYMLELKFAEILKQNASTAKFALVYMDIDNFKHINDTLGHESGDMLLKYISTILRSHIKHPDFAARLSGDEFVIIFNNVNDEKHISNRLEGILNHLRKRWVLKNQEFFISFSMGIAVYPDHGIDFTTLLKNADTAMFSVKKNDKDNFNFYVDEMNELNLKHVTLINELRHAIDNNEFTLYYQPQINLKTNKIVGVEALIRWMHPEKGLILPSDFITVAEDSGYIHQIGMWVLKVAAMQQLSWLEKGYPPIIMSINISGRKLGKANLVSNTENLLKDLNINPRHIHYEITETAFMENLNEALDILNKLKEMGITISLDDFGTGYSSLTYLRKLPIDNVKLDRQFIKNVVNEKDSEMIVKSIIGLTHSLNLKVVAEGVETEEQLSFLKKHGCDFCQGYLFSKPVPPEEIEKMLEMQLNGI